MIIPDELRNALQNANFLPQQIELLVKYFLPQIGQNDEGKVLKVQDGVRIWGNADGGALPDYQINTEINTQRKYIDAKDIFEQVSGATNDGNVTNNLDSMSISGGSGIPIDVCFDRFDVLEFKKQGDANYKNIDVFFESATVGINASLFDPTIDENYDYIITVEFILGLNSKDTFGFNITTVAPNKIPNGNIRLRHYRKYTKL